MTSFAERVTIFCFAASYGVALALEVWQLRRPRPILRYVSLGFGAAGLLAHTLYLFVQPLSLAAPLGSMLFLAWILTLFYLYGSIHHRKFAWGLFVLPLLLGLILLAVVMPSQTPRDGESWWSWGMIHGVLLLLAAVGICVSFIASVMYLVQVYRLKSKVAPTQGMKMLSLERIEAMNRHGVVWSFPLLTVSLLVGVVLQVNRPDSFGGWDSPKVLSGLGLWVVFAILLFLRYFAHARGRQLAIWTMVAFVLLVVSMVTVHPFVEGAGP